MKTHKISSGWDAAKFALRYGLNALAGDFFVGGDGLLHYPDSVPDEPIFELPDPPGPTKEQILEQRFISIEARLTAVEIKL